MPHTIQFEEVLTATVHRGLLKQLTYHLTRVQALNPVDYPY